MKKYLLSSLLIFSTGLVLADGHSADEKKVLAALEAYFDARTNKDWETVVSYESKSGTYGTNSDGSFHKPLVIQTAEGWASSNQGGVINVHYPEAIQLSDDVVFVRFYYEGVIETAGNSKPYRTRVTMNWVKEGGKWKTRSSHWSPVKGGSGTSQTGKE